MTGQPVQPRPGSAPGLAQRPVYSLRSTRTSVSPGSAPRALRGPPRRHAEKQTKWLPPRCGAAPSVPRVPDHAGTSQFCQIFCASHSQTSSDVRVTCVVKLPSACHDAAGSASASEFLEPLEEPFWDGGKFRWRGGFHVAFVGCSFSIS